MSDGVADDPLRRRALEILGPLGDPLARSVLERGAVLVEHDVRTWEGSHGAVRAHRVHVRTTAELSARALLSHVARDALGAALAAALAERGGQTLADLLLEASDDEPGAGSPYRDPRS